MIRERGIPGGQAVSRTRSAVAGILVLLFGAVIVLHGGCGSGESGGGQSPEGQPATKNEAYRLMVAAERPGASFGCTEWDCLWSGILPIAHDTERWQVLVDGSDITEYHWARQEFYVNDEAAARVFPPGKPFSPYEDRVFLVVVKGKPIYGGAIIMSASPSVRHYPVLYLERGDGPLVFRVRGTHRLSFLPDGANLVIPELERLIADKRIEEALRSYGVLRE